MWLRSPPHPPKSSSEALRSILSSFGLSSLGMWKDLTRQSLQIKTLGNCVCVCVCVYDVSFVKDCADEKKTYVLTVPDLTPRHSMAENEGLGLYRSAKVLVLKSD